MNKIKLNGRAYSEGEFITLNKNAKIYANAPPGLKVQIYSITPNGEQVGLYSPDKIVNGWSDLNGDVKDGSGWFISAAKLSMVVECDETTYEISQSTTYHGQELKGKLCKVIASIERNLVFVELEDNVGGCSADGLGKAGHCVAVPNNSIKRTKSAAKVNRK